MAFDYTYGSFGSKTTKARVEIPQITIYNNGNRSSGKYSYSYMFLNRAAVELLEKNGTANYVKVGIDIETNKICIIPTSERERKLSKMKSGSAQIALTQLIEINKIPTQICFPGEYRTYKAGGLIFGYEPQ